MKQFDPKSYSDAELVEHYASSHDDRAFAELVLRHGEMVMATAHRVLRSEQDVQDTLQITFMALAKSIKKLRDKSAIAGWLHRTAFQSAVTIQRSNARWNEKAQRKMNVVTSSSDGEGPSSAAAHAELMEMLDEEIAHLPPKLEAAIVLCDLKGLSHKEAAKALGIGVSTVDDRLTRGRKRLRASLAQRGVGLTVAGVAACVCTSKDAVAVTDPLVAEVTRRSGLFAAGKSASEIGVSSKVFNSATKVVSTMTMSRLTALSVIATVIGVSTGMLAIPFLAGDSSVAVRAGTLFVDDFNDGNFTDAAPVTWNIAPDSTGFVSALTGDLELAPTDGGLRFVAVGHEGIRTRNTSVRVQARTTITQDFAYVTARGQEDSTGYFATIGYREDLGPSSVFAVGRLDGVSDGVGQIKFFEAMDGDIFARLPHDVRDEDTEFQLDVFDDEIRGWAWPAGEKMPDEPQFVMTDKSFNEPGFVGLGLLPAPVNTLDGKAIFRYVHVADMPIHDILPSGDVDSDGTLSVSDIDAMVAAQRSERNSKFDTNEDGTVDFDDVLFWVDKLAMTFLGDANLDGEFNTTDLVAIFQANEYEDGIEANSNWASGDWNGDMEFDTADLVTAFQGAGFEQGPRTDVNAVPEPTSLVVITVLMASAAARRRPRRAVQKLVGAVFDA